MNRGLGALLVLSLLLLILAAMPATAGQITGRVLYMDGSPCSSCRVSASIKRSGVTDKVYTDSKGNFTLTWSSDNSIDELYVNGMKADEDITSGRYVEVHLD